MLLQRGFIGINLVQEEERGIRLLLVHVEAMAAALALEARRGVAHKARAERINRVGAADKVSRMDEHGDAVSKRQA